MDAKVSKKAEFYFIIITKYFILCNTYICTFTAFPTYSTPLACQHWLIACTAISIQQEKNEDVSCTYETPSFFSRNILPNPIQSSYLHQS